MRRLLEPEIEQSDWQDLRMTLKFILKKYIDTTKKKILLPAIAKANLDKWCGLHFCY